MKAYRNFIFDLDGTLLDTLPGLAEGVNHALTANGYPTHTVAAVRRFIGNGILKTIERALPDGLGCPGYASVLHDFTDYYAIHAAEHTLPFPGIPETLDTLLARGCTTACVTNKDHEVAVPMVAQYFGERISVTVGRKNGALPKPDPACVFGVMKELRLDPANTVYVGDSEVDYQTACNAGLDCLLVLWGYRDAPELLSLPAAGHLRAPEELLLYACARS